MHICVQRQALNDMRWLSLHAVLTDMVQSLIVDNAFQPRQGIHPNPCLHDTVSCHALVVRSLVLHSHWCLVAAFDQTAVTPDLQLLYHLVGIPHSS